MKKSILFLFLVSFSAFAQNIPAGAPLLPIDKVKHKITYKETISTTGISNNDLYSRSKDWFISNAKTLNSTLQAEDKTGGKLAGKCSFLKHTTMKDEKGKVYPFDFRVNYSVAIVINKDKAEVVLTNFSGNANNSPSEANIEGMYKALAMYQSKKMNSMDKQVDQALKDVLKEVNTKASLTLASIKQAITKQK